MPKLPPLKMRVMFKAHVLSVSGEHGAVNAGIYRVVTLHKSEGEEMGLFCWSRSLFPYLDMLPGKVGEFFCKPPSAGEYQFTSFKCDGQYYKAKSTEGKDLFGA